MLKKQKNDQWSSKYEKKKATEILHFAKITEPVFEFVPVS